MNALVMNRWRSSRLERVQNDQIRSKMKAKDTAMDRTEKTYTTDGRNKMAETNIHLETTGKKRTRSPRKSWDEGI